MRRCFETTLALLIAVVMFAYAMLALSLAWHRP